MADQIRTAPDWEDVRTFVALARHGALSAAARALRVSHATVARRLSNLEQSMGGTLAERRPGGYVLTELGRAALGAAADMEAAAERLPRLGAPPPAAGLVRISATPTLVEAFLIPRLAPLAVEHAQLDIELTADVRSVSLARRQADLALRLAAPESGELVVRKLGTLAFAFYADERWRQRLAAGDPPTFVGFDEATGRIPEADWLARSFPGARLAMRLGSQVAQAAAAENGLGVALLPRFLGDVRAALFPVLADHPPPTREVWLISRPHPATGPAVRMVRQALIDIFRDEADRLSPLPAG